MNDRKLTMGAWALDPGKQLLAQGTHTAELCDRALDLLWTLAQTPGEVVSATYLFELVWQGRVVEKKTCFGRELEHAAAPGR